MPLCFIVCNVHDAELDFSNGSSIYYAADDRDADDISNDIPSAPISKSEIHNAIRQGKSGKTCGVGGILRE